MSEDCPSPEGRQESNTHILRPSRELSFWRRVRGDLDGLVEVAEMSEEMSPNDVILHDLLRSDVKHINKPQFWDAVQRLHDQEMNWNQSGLSCSGKSFVMEEFGLTL